VKHAPSRGILGERQIEARARGFAQRTIFDVGGDADDLQRRRLRVEYEVAADGARSRPISRRHRFVDDHHRRLTGTIAAVEGTPFTNRDAQRLEVGRRDDVEVELHVFVGSRLITRNGDGGPGAPERARIDRSTVRGALSFRLPAPGFRFPGSRLPARVGRERSRGSRKPEAGSRTRDISSSTRRPPRARRGYSAPSAPSDLRRGTPVLRREPRCDAGP